MLDLLEESGMRAERRTGAPGVYVDDAKIAAWVFVFAAAAVITA